MACVQNILLVLAVIGALYYVFSTLALLSQFRSPKQTPAPYNAKISILKPICGIDPELEINLTTFLTQDHPNHEILLGVLDHQDPSLPILHRLTNATVHTGSAINGSNSKVRVLHTLAQKAEGDIFVITDADTRAAPNFLREITAPFADPQVGAVTCLYKGAAASTIAGVLEALHMTCIFAPGVASHNVKGIDFGLGAAIGVRKVILEEAGGFEILANYLADDFQLGRMISKAGYKVILSHHIIDITLGRESLKNVLKRELRWSVTTRVSRPWGHLGLVFTFGFTYALAFFAVSSFSKFGMIIFISALLIRLTTAWLGASVSLGDRQFTRTAHLLPLRDILSFAIWVAGYFTHTVNWRGRTLKVQKNGKMKSE